MSILDSMAVGMLVSIPVWFFSWIVFLMYLDGEYGVYCTSCKQRHLGLCLYTERKDRHDNKILEWTAKSLGMFMIMGALVAVLVKLLNYLTGF